MNCPHSQPRNPQVEVKRALIAVGSNLSHNGKPVISGVCDAMARLAHRSGGSASFSRLYHTPAFPAGSGPDFINAAMAMDWGGTAAELLALLHEIERDQGRTRRARWEARKLDLDLIALGDQVLPDAATQGAWRDLPPEDAARRAPNQLILPHPRLAERSFVLVPLADVAPSWRHPVTGVSVQDMLAALPQADRDSVKEAGEVPPISEGLA